jgi:hypothetical protein
MSFAYLRNQIRLHKFVEMQHQLSNQSLVPMQALNKQNLK